MRFQRLSGKQLPDFIKLTTVMNGLKGSVKSFVLLNLDGNSSFGDLDNLLARYFSMHDQHESSLDSLQDIARRDMSGFKLGQLEPGGKREGKRKRKPQA